MGERVASLTRFRFRARGSCPERGARQRSESNGGGSLRIAAVAEAGPIDACREFCNHRFMAAGDGIPLDHLKVVDNDFLNVFMPYELRLAQRRAMVWGAEA